MAARPKVGGGRTPVRVVELLQEEVAKTSQAATARATGITLKGIQNYLKGIGDPTTATLQKLAKYFNKEVWWLREEIVLDNGEREKASARFWEAVQNMIDRGNLTIDDRHDLGTIQTEFSVIMEDACMFEKILLHEEGNREALIKRSMAIEWKEFSKEIDVLAEHYMQSDEPEKTD